MIALVLVIVAAICFLLGAMNVTAPINWTPLGLFWLTLALLIAGWWPALVTRGGL